MRIKTYTLKTENSIPSLGLGTWRLSGIRGIKTVRKALELGYRHIDTAEIYNNQQEIGKAIKKFDRSELFLTSKVWKSNLHYEDVLDACDSTLKELNTSYLDLYLIHWPNRNVPLEETFKSMMELQRDGKVRSIGVSNFNIPLLKEAMRISEFPICVNQVEFHPYLYQKELLNFCKENEIILTAYSPLSKGKVSRDETLKTVGEKYNKTPAQVTLRWMLQKDIAVIPKASSTEHLKENLNVFEFELSEKDMKKVDSIQIKKRNVDTGWIQF